MRKVLLVVLFILGLLVSGTIGYLQSPLKTFTSSLEITKTSYLTKSLTKTFTKSITKSITKTEFSPLVITNTKTITFTTTPMEHQTEINLILFTARRYGLDEDTFTYLVHMAKDGFIGAEELHLIIFLSRLPKEAQVKFLSTIMSDGEVNIRDLEQIIFLESLPSRIFNEAVKDGRIYDFDWDDDNMDNYFEAFIAHLPVDVKNERFLVFVETGNITLREIMEEERRLYYDLGYLIKKYRFKDENLIFLLGKNATFDNFEKAILKIAQKATENDIIYILIGAHGSPGLLFFSDKGISYQQLDKIFDRISHAKVLVIGITACYCTLPKSWTALKEGPIPRIIVAPGQWIFHHSSPWGGGPLFLIRHVKPADLNGDGHISLEENWIQTMVEEFRTFANIEPRFKGRNTIKDGTHTWHFYFDKDGGFFEAQYSNGTLSWSYIFYNPKNITLYLGDANVEELCGSFYDRNDPWIIDVIQNILSRLEGLSEE